MPVYTRRASDTIVLMRVGSSNRAANDAHLTIGKGSGSKSDYIGRVEVRFPEPTWPTAGTFVRAYLDVQETGSDLHPEWEGDSSRIDVKRMGEKAKFSLPASADGHGTDGYTTEGTGDKYPGAAPVGSPVTVNVQGTERIDVTSMVRQMLPTRFGGADSLYGYFNIRSANEDSASRSVVLSRYMYLSVEIDTRVVPNEATVLEVIGTQGTDTEPTIVATDDGQTLAVRFGFAAGPGETCAKATLELYGTGATDTTPGTRLAYAVNAPPSPGGGVNIHIARLTGIPKETEGKWRLRLTSSTGKDGPWTSLEDSSAHVLMATIPGAPVDVVVEPTTDAPEISASLPSSHPGTITAMEAHVTLLPQGRVQTIDSVIGGSLRRASLTYSGETLGDGQQTSTVVRLTDENGVVGRWGAPVRQTHHVPAPAAGPVLTPASGRLLTLRPTFTITGSTFDGWRLRLLHETDDSIVIYDSGETTVVDQTTVSPQIPANVLSYGQRFRATASLKFDGEPTYEAEITPQPYSIAALPSAALSVLESAGGIIYDQTPTWRRTITDPDGGTIVSTILEIREANATPGAGAFITRYVGSPGTGDLIIPGLTLDWEQDIDVRLWARNDITALLGTTLNGGVSAGVSQVTLTSTSGLAGGSRFIIYSATAGLSEERAVATLPGANVVTFTDPLEHAHLNGETVSAYAPGTGAWQTYEVLEPPEVDLLTPLDGVTISRPWQTLDWLFTGNGGRTQVSAVVTLYDEDGAAVHSIAVDDTTSTVNIPAYLLDTATTYLWDVTVTDSEGLETTSEQRTFTTAFVEPAAVAAVSADADPEASAVIVSWPEVLDADLHHMEVSWQADDGSWVRIDGGPEELDDGLTPMYGTTLTHIGARLGSNVYSVVPHNGWAGAQPVTATAVLTVGLVSAGTWQMVRGDGQVIPQHVMDASATTTAMLDMQQPLGGSSRALAWGIEGRRIPIQATTIPSEDGLLATTLRQLMADPARSRTSSGAWVKAPAGYVADPVWCVLASFTVTPQANGFMQLSQDWLEVAPPVHAILPEPPEEPDDDVGQLVLSESEHDFGDVIVAE